MKKFAFLLLVCIATLFVGCENVEPEKVDTATTSQTESKTETYKIGDSVKAGNLIFTVNSTREDEGPDFAKPDAGNIYYLVDVTAENTGDKSEVISTIMMFELADSEGYTYDIRIGAQSLAKGSLDGEVSAGRKLRGELGFEIPKDASGLELVIDPTFGSGQIIVALDR